MLNFVYITSEFWVQTSEFVHCFRVQIELCSFIIQYL